MDSLSTFLHASLPDSTTHIRLLEIQQGSSNQHVVCSLSTWALSAAPAYYAISYTWGDSALTAIITINGQRMVVRQNCKNVLQQAFDSKASRYFWVDALCIDQASTQEKNHQVAMMGQIYKKAAHVFACVGAHGSDSEYLFDILDRNKNLFLKIHANILANLANEKHEEFWGKWFIEHPAPNTRKLARRCYFTMSVMKRKRLVAAFLSFMRRPYFSRVWILQELHLGVQVSFCCSNDIRSSDLLLALDLLVEIWLHDHAYLPRPVARNFYMVPFPRVVSNQSTRYAFRGIKSQRGCLGLASGTRSSWLLEEVMHEVQQFECADPRDKVYGVLSLVQWKKDEAPVPDYEKDILEVATEVMNILFVCRTAQALQCAQTINLVFMPLNVNVSEGMKRALQRRATGRIIQEVYESRFCAHLGTESWYGIRLFYEVSRNVRYGNTDSASRLPRKVSMRRSSSPDANPTEIELVDQDGTVFAFAPPDTREGDWYILYRSLFTIHNRLSMIVRATKDQSHQYTLIGQVLQCAQAHWSWRYSARNFYVHWHPEDILLLERAYTMQPLIGYNDTAKDREAWLRTSICGMPHSSYAIKKDKKFDPDRLRELKRLHLTKTMQQSRLDPKNILKKPRTLLGDPADYGYIYADDFEDTDDEEMDHNMLKENARTEQYLIKNNE